jgi:isocitrate lyase
MGDRARDLDPVSSNFGSELGGAGDTNLAGHTYPDQSLYPANSVPSIVRRINNALTRADQIQWAEGDGEIDWFAPIVVEAEAGFGGPLNAFELMKGMIEAGAGGVHFEDQLSSEKKWAGRRGGPHAFRLCSR